MKKIIRFFLYSLLLLVLASASFFFFYANSLRGVNPKTVAFYDQMKVELKRQGHRPAVVVISGHRAGWHNRLLTAYGAARKSQHLEGNAVDFMVMDVNGDGDWDRKDVAIVTKILEKIIGNKGGIGTYSSEEWFWNRQMVHIDCRGKKARWNR